MPSVDYRSLAVDVLDKVGGEENVASLTHCATRLRFKLKDVNKADKAAVERLAGVITVMEAGGQFQVVVGNNVPIVYAEIGQISKLTAEGADTGGGKEEGSLLNRFIALVSVDLPPILWPLAGAGLLKAFLAMGTQFGWLDAASTTYAILNAAADGAVLLPADLPRGQRGQAVQDQPVHLDGDRGGPVLPGHRRPGQRRPTRSPSSASRWPWSPTPPR